MDLLSLHLTLSPLPSPRLESPLPNWWGRAAQALLLNIVARVNPGLAESLHEENQIRPYTASTLFKISPKPPLAPGKTCSLRFTSYEPTLTALLLQAIRPGGSLSPASVIELDFLPFAIQTIHWQTGETPWSACTDYAGLAAHHLTTAAVPSRRIRIQFASPTHFKQDGKNMPLPVPALVFGSLLERWNAFAPITFPPEVRRFAEECLAVNQFELSSQAVPAKESGWRFGATGIITYTALNYDRYWLSVLHTLADFSFFSGIGAATSIGMGQCRPLPPDQKRPTEE